MSTHPTLPAPRSEEGARIDLILAQASFEQALRVAELAHAGVAARIQDLPRHASAWELRDLTEDSILLFQQTLRLAVERGQTVVRLCTRWSSAD